MNNHYHFCYGRHEATSVVLCTTFHTDCSSPVYYDLVLNTERGTLESLSQIIEQTVRLELFQPTPESLRAMQNLSLATQVQAALLRVPGLSTLNIQVRAEGNEVSLTGAVFGPYWAELATQVAQTVSGAGKVTCQTSENPPLYAVPRM